MGKLRVLSGREVCDILSRQGFVRLRQHGSHIIMQRRDGTDTTTVPAPNHKEVRRGTLQSIVRQSGLAKALFEA